MHRDDIAAFLQHLCFQKKCDTDAWSAIHTVVSKILCASKREVEISEWMYLSLDKHGLQQQDDAHSCGVFTCLVTLTDVRIAENDLIPIRMWIGKACIDGANYIQKKSRKASSLWATTKTDDQTISNF